LTISGESVSECKADCNTLVSNALISQGDFVMMTHAPPASSTTLETLITTIAQGQPAACAG
jgi:hypothetical protein